MRFIKMVVVLEYYILYIIKKKYKIKIIIKMLLTTTKFYFLCEVEFGRFLRLRMFLFVGCRSPPVINLILKIELIGGKKDGRTPKKKKT